MPSRVLNSKIDFLTDFAIFSNFVLFILISKYFSFHAYNTQPLPTETLTPEQILKFRDEAYVKYHTHKPFLNKVKKEYGNIAVDNILKNTKIKLKRKILGD